MTAPTFHLPCAYDGHECNDEAIGRTHDAEDLGYASAYVCAKHIDWGHSWVQSWTKSGSAFSAFRSERSAR